MAQRRGLGGARREASEKVVVEREGSSVEGWTLNVSRGGVRVVVDVPLQVGVEYLVQVGEAASRAARVVWVRDEADGQIAGLQYLDADAPSGPSWDPPPSGAAPSTIPPAR